MINCEQIKMTVSIADVIGQVVPLKRHGRWYRGRCPFHNDHHPSLVVWPATGTWQCMTCSPRRDDVIGFVAQWQGCSVAEALRWLQEAYPLAAWTTPPAVLPSPDPPSPLAPLTVRHDTYQRLLRDWGLSALHRQQLLTRGLRSRTIHDAGFASAVPGQTRVVPTMSGIPGFTGQGRHWHVVGPAGLAIPVRDLTGSIQAIHLRTDQSGPGKYRWFSTPTQIGGGASGAPVHVARGVDDIVWITEGPLKAIVAQERLRHTVLGVPGVGAWHGVLDILPDLHPYRVVLAFDHDTDPDTVQRVAQHTRQLTQALQQAGWAVWQAQWTGPKGLDDALVAQARITFQPLPCA